jgi:hypothetical protein
MLWHDTAINRVIEDDLITKKEINLQDEVKRTKKQNNSDKTVIYIYRDNYQFSTKKNKIKIS